MEQMDIEDNATSPPTAEMTSLLNTIIQMQTKMSEMEKTIKQQHNRIEQQQATINDQNERISNLEQYSCWIEGKCIHLENQMEGQEYWEYLAPPLTAADWQARGHDDQVCNAMDNFLCVLKKTVYMMRNGEGDGRIQLRVPNDMYNCGPYQSVIYEDILDPHWKEFANALLQYPNLLDWEGLCPSLQIIGVNLHRSVINTILPALKGFPFQGLHFCDNGLFNEYDFILQLVARNPGLNSLSIIKNEELSETTVETLCRIIQTHPKLTRIEFRNIQNMFDGTNHFCSLAAASHRMKSVVLSGLNITSMGSTIIPDFLATNPAMETLDLSKNNFNDDDAILFAMALKKNTNLKSLNLAQNNIAKSGYDALCNALFTVTNLNDVNDCNHTCHVTIDRDSFRLVSFNPVKYEYCKYCIPNINDCPRGRVAVRIIKLFSLVSAPNEKRIGVQYLEQTPQELMPRVLEFIQEYPVPKQWYWMSLLMPKKSVDDTVEANNESDNASHETVEDSFDDANAWYDYEEPETEEEQRIREEKEKLEEEKQFNLKKFNIMFEVLRGCTMQIFVGKK